MTPGLSFGPGTAVGVLLPLPFDGPLDYLVPDDMSVRPGDFVEVALGARRTIGVVWGPGAGTLDRARLRPIEAAIDAPPMAGALCSFLDRAAAYTMTPPGLMMRLATRVSALGKAARMRTVYAPTGTMPARMTPARQRVLDAVGEGGPDSASALAERAGVTAAVVTGLARAGALAPKSIPVDAPFPPLWGQAPGHHLSDAQRVAADVLRSRVTERAFSATLLRGVTGSGKTEVYLEAAAATIAAGRQALVLVPEVALTAQFLDRVEQRFGARPAEWHHGIAPPARRRVWHGIADGSAQMVVGARSALFLPFRDLGLVVIDEEHDGSYKQEEGVFYSARDMAVLRASVEGAAVVLASATPSLETWVNAEQGRYHRLDLPRRFGAAEMPEMRLIDLRSESLPRDRWITEPMAAAVTERIGRDEQALLFLNRRGYAPMTLCRGCGHQMGCPDCDAWLVTHRFQRRLVCHQCGYSRPEPDVCPGCGDDDRLAVCGPGVERLEEEARALWPEARIAVLSSDLFPNAADLRACLADIAAGGADIVIGTQLVAKGHNFPNLTLVGVIDGDMILHGGDLRAAERTFQVLQQVAGRAGRADKPGRALIQTAAPDEPVMHALLSGEAETFWRSEAEARRAAGAPPFGRFAGVILSGPDDARVWEVAHALGRHAPMFDRDGAQLFGPAAAPIGRVRGRSRVRFLVKAPRGVPLQDLIARWRATTRVPSNVRLHVDIDPQSFL